MALLLVFFAEKISMKEKLIFCIWVLFYSYLLSSCNLAFDVGNFKSDKLPECPIDEKTTQPCKPKLSHYVYAEVYGSRVQEQTDLSDLLLSPSLLIQPLSNGWLSQTRNVMAQDPKLIAANIANGVNIFGVDGTFDRSAIPTACSEGLNSASICTASKDAYTYNTPFNGRAQNCENLGNGVLNSQCWISQPAVISSSAEVSLAACSPGLISASSGCRALQGGYVYESHSGGRSLNCASTGNNTNPCWLSATISQPKIVVQNGVKCQEGTNSMSCVTNPNSFVYDSLFGGRSAVCDSGAEGMCFMSSSSKSIFDGALNKENIKEGVTIFGIAGEFTGEGGWTSGMHRNRVRNAIRLQTETGLYSGINNNSLPAGYRPIPKIISDDEGFLNTEVLPVNRDTWGATSCGQTGTIKNRIANCRTVLGLGTQWSGTLEANASQGSWKLVSRLGAKVGSQAQEVWIDERTGLLWSSVVSVASNWCHASGSSNTSDGAIIARYREDDPADICDQNANQVNDNKPISLCKELLSDNNFGANHSVNGKGGLSRSSTPAVYWRLPTLNDYENAEYNGIRFVLPDMGSSGGADEWTATVVSSDKAKSWIYNSSQGFHLNRNRQLTASVRCIGRAGSYEP